MAKGIQYVRKPTPIRSLIGIASTVSCFWMGAFFYGLHSGHVQYFPLVVKEVPGRPVAAAEDDGGVLSFLGM
jgi:hypothetical protein